MAVPRDDDPVLNPALKPILKPIVVTDAPAPLPAPNRATAAEEVGQRADTVAPESQVAEGRHRAWAPRIGAQGLTGADGPVVLVAACRTPFAPAGGALATMEALDLAGEVTAELLARAGLDPADVEALALGCATPPLDSSNLARECALRASLPASTLTETLAAGSVSGSRAILAAARWILAGEARVVVAGGADAVSQRPVTFSRNAARRLQELGRAKSVAARLTTLGKLRFKDLSPSPPPTADATTGRTLSDVAEAMAQENDISRRAQDEVALASHQRAAAAMGSQRRDAPMATFVAPRHEDVVEDDSAVRAELTVSELSGMAPMENPRWGTVSAATVCAPADGAGALLLMGEGRAKALGIEPRATLRGWATAAVDPAGQPLQAAAHAVARALAAVGLDFADLDALEIHEAAAAQILSNAKAWASSTFAASAWERGGALGTVDLERVNSAGGSLALGHPPAATGPRLVQDVVAALERGGGGFGVAVTVDPGGLADALVWEVRRPAGEAGSSTRSEE